MSFDFPFLWKISPATAIAAANTAVNTTRLSGVTSPSSMLYFARKNPANISAKPPSHTKAFDAMFSAK